LITTGANISPNVIGHGLNMTVTWKTLNDQLADLTEQEVLDLLEMEQRHARRSTILVRLHQRYTVLRMLRERAALMEMINESSRTTV
jgi:hypothetical protein